MRARSGAAMRRVAAIRANRLSRQQHPFVAFVEVICGALLLGLFGAGVGAVWSLALGFSTGIGALCAGLVVFVLDLVLLPIDARFRKGILARDGRLGATRWGDGPRSDRLGD